MAEDAKPKEHDSKAKDKPSEDKKEQQPPKQQKPQQPTGSAPAGRKKRVDVSDSTPAQVVKVFGKTGLTGECYQVMVRILGGPDKGNLLRRNVMGPVRENDVLMLRETERDVRSI